MTIDLNDRELLQKFNTVNEILVLLEILNETTNKIWTHDGWSRSRMARKLNLSEIAIKIILKQLINKQILHKIKRGEYQVLITQ